MNLLFLILLLFGITGFYFSDAIPRTVNDIPNPNENPVLIFILLYYYFCYLLLVLVLLFVFKFYSFLV